MRSRSLDGGLSIITDAFLYLSQKEVNNTASTTAGACVHWHRWGMDHARSWSIAASISTFLLLLRPSHCGIVSFGTGNFQGAKLTATGIAKRLWSLRSLAPFWRVQGSAVSTNIFVRDLQLLLLVGRAAAITVERNLDPCIAPNQMWTGISGADTLGPLAVPITQPR
jgi:hypothetical protein